MRSQLKLVPHMLAPEQAVIEIWYDGQFIGEVTGDDGPGVRVISKHHADVQLSEDSAPYVAEIRINV